MKTKSFDCVEMKRQSAEKIFKVIQHLTPEEELRYWNNKKINK